MIVRRALAAVLLLAAIAALALWWFRPRPPAEPALVLRAARFSDLPGWDEDDPRPALEAFARSCRLLEGRRADETFARDPAFGRVGDWRASCSALHGPFADARAARAALERLFRPWLVTDRGEARGLVTGYFEPILEGARTADAIRRYPIYRRPDDLVVVELGRFDPTLEGRRIVGRVEQGRLLPYYTRAEIDGGALAGRGLELAWVDDPIALFFLHVQGSGRIRLAEGGELRVGYAEQNGHPYRAIGRDLVEAGELAREEVSMQRIEAWLRAHPERAFAFLHKNPSYVFFRELGLPPDAPGPLGAQGAPLTPQRSLAVDRRFLPLGALLWLDTEAPFPDGARSLRRLVVAQDTGGAIRGPVRGDLFWGSGPEAEHLAGHMKSPGRLWLLVPTGLDPTRPVRHRGRQRRGSEASRPRFGAVRPQRTTSAVGLGVLAVSGGRIG
ncbi:MAG: MltA domain-containing protein [Geminicoccaceae bacterium]|nr:MltA domain-containing protein [Geminicoccaceae bacterium]MCS7266555.1 MltA domain-containing protein [Geminicoccaceae bacterium]MCX7628982.1 MltA domain-containing protein [Geminicoccaceae bacterium]MDW8125622.1 MltA domain-containing protein [Geminicoccaceae bacterium]MDW8340088.1 MltA domain-containing protein [Geminicoccaceae bacterium]